MKWSTSKHCTFCYPLSMKTTYLRKLLIFIHACSRIDKMKKLAEFTEKNVQENIGIVKVFNSLGSKGRQFIKAVQQILIDKVYKVTHFVHF